MLGRRVCVAAMMDWTDGVKMTIKSNGLRSANNGGSFLVALS